MYKFFFIPFVIFFCTVSFAEKDSIYAELQIRGFSYEGKEIKFEIPKVIILKKIGCSDIVSLGYANDKEIGLQLEILKSSFGNDSLFVIGKAFFLKVNGDWKIGSIIHYQERDFKKISDWGQLNNKDFSVGNFSVNKYAGEFQVAYRERCYVLK